MGIRIKPSQASSSATTADERHINALIEKGGSVAADAGEHSKPMLVQLRLSQNLIQQIDRGRKKRTVPPSRHAWILEALLDKLKAEK
jgi:hypothetical protein